MRSTTRSQSWLLSGTIAVTALLTGIGSAVVAQVADTGIEPVLHIRQGDVFEIVAAPLDAETVISWVLTRGGTFVEAGRESVFHLRLLESGTYELDASINDADGQVMVRRKFPIEVSSTVADSPRTSSGRLLTTVPATEDDFLTLDETQSSVTLIPNLATQGPINLDLDVTTDTDGDGDTANDNDAMATLFSSDHTPLHVWFPVATRNQTLVATTTDGTKSELTVTRHSGASSVVRSRNLTIGEIHVNARNAGEVTFALPIDHERDDMILFRWDFGDGHRSLRDAPSHRYGKDGVYTVRAEAVDMRTGDTVVQAEREITVSTEDIIDPEDEIEPEDGILSSSSSSRSSRASSAVSSSEASNSASSETTTDSTPRDTGWIWTVLALAGVALAALIVGILIIALIKFISRKAGGMDTSFSPRTGPDTPTTPDDPFSNPPPLELTRSTDPEPAPVIEPEPTVTIDPEPVGPVNAPEPQQQINMDSAPPWLKRGLDQPMADAPAAEPTPEPAAEPATPSPEPVVTEQAPTPSWLQQAQAQEVPAPAPEPAPVVEPAAAPSAPEPAPAVEAPVVTEPAPATQEPIPAPPAPTTPDNTLPPWLQQAPAAPTAPAEPAPALQTAPTEPTQPTTPAAPVETLPPWLKNDAPPTVTPEPAPSAPTEPVTAQPIAPTTPSPATVAVVEEPKVTKTTETPKTETAKPATSADPAIAERLAREQERKRLKRKRYRENLRKRAIAEKQSETASTPATAPVTTTQAPAQSSPQKTKVAEQDIPPLTPTDNQVHFIVKAENVKPEDPNTLQAS